MPFAGATAVSSTGSPVRVESTRRERYVRGGGRGDAPPSGGDDGTYGMSRIDWRIGSTGCYDCIEGRSMAGYAPSATPVRTDGVGTAQAHIAPPQAVKTADGRVSATPRSPRADAGPDTGRLRLPENAHLDILRSAAKRFD
ncbi:hypothetical protein GCM10027176_55800 [Actinoallomurus bryophytorum]